MKLTLTTTTVVALWLCLLMGRREQQAECLVQNLTIPNVASDIKITWENQGDKTWFSVRAKLADVDITNCWIGVGLNDRIEMANTNAVICRYAAPKRMYIRHNLNQPSFSALMDSANPIVGLSNLSLVLNQDTIVCKFARDNVNPTTSGYYQITPESKPFLITAWGTGDVSYHENNFGASQSPISFPLDDKKSSLSTKTSQVATSTLAPSTTTTAVSIDSSSSRGHTTVSTVSPAQNTTVVNTPRIISNTTNSAGGAKIVQNVNSIRAFFMKLFNWLFNLFKSDQSAKSHH